MGIADSVRGDGWELQAARFGDATHHRLQQALARGKLDALVDVRNPLDLTPMADDAAHEECLRAFLQAPEVDMVLCATVPLTPAMATLSEGVPPEQSFHSAGSLVNRVTRLASETQKPLVVSVDSGVLFDAYARAFEHNAIPTYRSADVAVRTMGLYAESRLRSQAAKA